MLYVNVMKQKFFLYNYQILHYVTKVYHGLENSEHVRRIRFPYDINYMTIEMRHVSQYFNVLNLLEPKERKGLF